MYGAGASAARLHHRLTASPASKDMSDVFRTASPASKDTHDPPAGELFCMGVRDDVEFTKPFLFCMLLKTDGRAAKIV
jgi:hypothetical protein